MSLDTAIIDIGSSVFEMAQMYVALSRVRTRQGLYLIDFDPSKLVADKKVIKEYERLSEKHLVIHTLILIISLL